MPPIWSAVEDMVGDVGVGSYTGVKVCLKVSERRI